jgi:hypothetical protein
MVYNSTNHGSVSAGTTTNARYWAFCGPQWGSAGSYSPLTSFDDPAAWTKAQAMRESGMDATHGPCLPVPAGYKAAFPGSRYGTPAQQFGTLWVNAHYGMKTIIYDARLWSSNAATRQAAIDFWSPHRAWIEAIDLGDEYPCWETNIMYDPNTNFTGTQWQHLGNRYATLWYYVTNNSSSPGYPIGLQGIPGYTTHFSPQFSITASGLNCVEMARWNFLNAWSNLGFDDYSLPSSTWWANWINTNVGAGNFVCAISVLENVTGHQNVYGVAPSYVVPPFTASNPDVNKISQAVGRHRQYGCDTMLFFNPGDSKSPAPFSGRKGLANVGGVGRSDWGAAAAISKNYITP